MLADPFQMAAAISLPLTAGNKSDNLTPTHWRRREEKKKKSLTNLMSRDVQIDVGDGQGSRGQHGDDHHLHVGARRRRIAGKVEENPQAVSIEDGHRQQATW